MLPAGGEQEGECAACAKTLRERGTRGGQPETQSMRGTPQKHIVCSGYSSHPIGASLRLS
jgi:hypothetical protein